MCQELLCQASSYQLLELQVRINVEFLYLFNYIGAGKTTLLNYLSGREISTTLNKKGNIFINGVAKEKIEGFASYSAYVQ
jgi:ABC-type uncharacterized transport system ATPase component